MTRLAVHHGAINLAQGFPDFPAPAILKDAAAQAIDADINQYAITWGAKPFRNAIAAQIQAHLRNGVRPGTRNHGLLRRHRGHDREPAGGAGSGRRSGAFRALLRELRTRHAALRRHLAIRHPAGARLDVSTRTNCARAFTPRTKAIILNSPNNPTGKVFSREELECIAGLCQEFDCLAITDEIYEHILYDGTVHVPILSLPGMRDRTILVNSMSKTYSVTGWRVGWVLASPDLTDSIRKVHDFLTVGAAAPLQQAGVVALSLPDDYYSHLSTEYAARRDHIVTISGNCRIQVFYRRMAHIT